MKKNGKKVLLSLTATMLLASSVGHAQNFNYRDLKITHTTVMVTLLTITIQIGIQVKGL